MEQPDADQARGQKLNRRNHIARLARTCRAYLPSPRTGLRLGLAVAVLIVGSESLQNAIAEGDTRAITMHHLHTGEDINITYKVNGRYDQDALKKLDWFLRDWRENKSISMDPHLFDLIWEVDREVEGNGPIQIVCGYRDESTNSMLRRRSTGVAQFSQHTLGKAMDFYIPGVALEKIRVAGLRLQRGGVGFYPTSGSPFVHLDVGGVRHWPRMTREQLVRIFPDGRTVHIPSDGHPLPGYALALADIERQGGRPSGMSLASAERAGMVEDGEVAPVAPTRSLLASLFGGGDTATQAVSTTTNIAAKPAIKPMKPIQVAFVPVPLPKLRPRGAMTVIASVTPAPKYPVRTARIVVAAAGPTPADVIRDRGYWVGVPDPAPTLTGGRLILASAESENTGSVPPQFLTDSAVPGPQMLAYAAIPAAAQPQRHSVVTRWAGAATSIAGKAVPSQAAIAPPAYDPWLDAVAITPSVRTYLSATQYGVRDFTSLRPLLDKPAAAVAMAFSQDPQPSLSSERFAGSAVVFIDMVTFGGDMGLKTASLR